LDRRENRILPVPIGNRLIDRDPEEWTHRVPARAGAREQDRATRVVPARLFVGGRCFRHIQPGNQGHTVAEWLQRLCDEGELEVFAVLQRAPVTGRSAMRMPDTDKAFGRRRSGQP
jgi:hypothetical protein